MLLEHRIIEKGQGENMTSGYQFTLFN